MPAFFWHSTAGEYVELLGTFDGPLSWAFHVRGSGGREWRTHADTLRPLNSTATALLKALRAEVES